MEVVLKTSLPESWLTDRGSDSGKPIHEQGSNPSSDGYANGGRPEAIGSTGGSEVVDQAPGDYSRPIVDLPESGLVYQDSASDEKAKFLKI